MKPTNTNCIFCKIAKKQIPTDILYENNKTIAFLDINPVNKGHTLVIPKEHYETIIDIPEDLLIEVIKTTKKISIALSKISDGITIAQNNKKSGGQEIPHLHFHIIPRYKNDGLKYNWPTKKYKEGETQQLVEKIKNLL